jgi:hypothetical protein
MLYSNKKADFSGLSVHNGRLINNQPDGKTGIQKMAQIRKDMKAAKKISQIAEGTRLGSMMEDMMHGCSECE